MAGSGAAISSRCPSYSADPGYDGTAVNIFKEYTLMLTAFEKAEFEIAKSISSSIRYKSSLEAVETGSIITKIKSWIEDKEPDLGNENLKKLNTQEYI